MAIIAAYMVPHPPMIVPEVGRGSERQVEATRTAYLRAAEDIAALQPETVIISSPHATMYADYFHLSPGREAAGSFAQFRAPQVRFRERYDVELIKTAERIAAEENFPAGTRGQREAALDHGTMVPLYLISRINCRPTGLTGLRRKARSMMNGSWMSVPGRRSVNCLISANPSVNGQRNAGTGPS